MHNACIGELGNTPSLPIIMMNVVFETTPFWALGVYGRILKAPIPQYTAISSEVYGRILRKSGRLLRSIRPYTPEYTTVYSGVYGRILGVLVCAMWFNKWFQLEKFHCCTFCAHGLACFTFAKQLHTI